MIKEKFRLFILGTVLFSAFGFVGIVHPSDWYDDLGGSQSVSGYDGNMNRYHGSVDNTGNIRLYDENMNRLRGTVDESGRIRVYDEDMNVRRGQMDRGGRLKLHED